MKGGRNSGVTARLLLLKKKTANGGCQEWREGAAPSIQLA